MCAHTLRALVRALGAVAVAVCCFAACAPVAAQARSDFKHAPSARHAPQAFVAEPATARELAAEAEFQAAFKRLRLTLGGPSPACEYDAAALNGFEERCAAASSDDCVLAALGHSRGCGTQVNSTKAEELTARACKLGNLLGCSTYAALLLNEPEPRLSESINVLRTLCSQGLQRACSNVGIALTTRVVAPTPEQLNEGVELVRTGCRKHLSGCSAYGGLIMKLGLRERFAEALGALRASCSAEHLESCYNLAVALEDGSLGVQNHHEAARVAFEACEKGHLEACNRLGYMFAQGHGVRKDEIRAAAILYSACLQGSANACDSTGEAIENGWLFPKDNAQAREFYKYACDYGNVYSCKRPGVQKETPPQ